MKSTKLTVVMLLLLLVGTTFTCIDGPVFDYWSVLNLKEAI